MYNSYYSHSKLGVSTKKIHKARGKSCGYYMKIVFFFSSLIQTLIIVSLVLFLIYGQPEESATEKRLQELDPMHNDLKAKYGYLLDENRNLTRKMNITNRQMEYLHSNITKLRKLGNQSVSIIIDLQMLMSRCQINQPQPCNCPKISTSPQCQSNAQLNALQYENNQLKNWLEIVKKNFSDTVYALTVELKNTKDDKMTLKLASITLGREKAILEDEIKIFKKKCQDEFLKSLEGVPEITKTFREKINTLFPHFTPFHITCNKQHEQLEQIRNNCSSLSAQVENKFQAYLNDIVYKVSNTFHSISHLQATTKSLEKSLGECKKNLSSQVEEYLLDIRKSTDAKQLLDKTLSVKESEINKLKEKLNTTLAYCGQRSPSPKPGSTPLSGGVGMGTGGRLPGGDSTFSVQAGPGMNNPSAPRTGFSNSGTAVVNAGGTRSGPGTGGMGSSGSGVGSSKPGSGLTGSAGSMGSTGSSLETGAGAVRTGFGSSTSSGSSGAGFSFGSSKTGTGRSGPGGTGFGSSSSSGSNGAGFSFGSSGTGAGAGHGGTGFSSTGSMGPSGAGFGNTGSLGAGGSSRTPFSGTGSSTSWLGNTGSGGAGSSRTGPSGTGFGGTGFGGTSGYGSFSSGGTGAGRTGMSASGLGRTGPGGTMYGGVGASDPISKHLRELQKYLNPEWE